MLLPFLWLTYGQYVVHASTMNKHTVNHAI